MARYKEVEIGIITSRKIAKMCENHIIVKALSSETQDGCRLPSNASKEYSGTKEELRAKYEKLKKMIREIMKKHRENDRIGKKEKDKEKKKLKTLRKKADKILDFLNTHEDRRGASGEIVKSDNNSSKCIRKCV